MKALITNALVFAGGELNRGWLLTDGERIAAMGNGDPAASVVDVADNIRDAGGAMLLPGLIDTHVHFREPGLTRKATIASESRAALAGGITSYCEMPNTVPPTCSRVELDRKMEIAARDSVANYAFFPGASGNNLEFLESLDTAEVPGIKLFIGSSTGNMAVAGMENLEAVFRIAAEKGLPVMVHAEDDAIIAANAARAREEAGEGEVDIALHSDIRSAKACLKASALAVRLAEKFGTRLHIAHVTTADEVDSLLSAGPTSSKRVTAEVTPLHLVFTKDDYPALGSRIKVNPAAKTVSDRERLHEALADGEIDTIGTDHAPHLLSEKEGGALRAASGAPMAQFAMPLLLRELGPGLLVARMAEAPAQLFGIRDRGSLKPGNFADFVLVREVPEYTVADSDVLSPCGWTPLVGQKLHHRVVETWVNGSCAYADGRFSDKLSSKPLEFEHP